MLLSCNFVKKENVKRLKNYFQHLSDKFVSLCISNNKTKAKYKRNILTEHLFFGFVV